MMAGRREVVTAGGLLMLLLVSCSMSGSPGQPPIEAAVPSSRPPAVPSEPGESHLRDIRQLTFGGNNAESYFSKSGKQLVFQRQEVRA